MVKSVTGATGAEFEALTAKAKELGKTSKFTMTDIASGMEFLARAGFETNEIISAMDGVVALASSQVMDLGRAADITSNILTGMGLEAGEAGRVADVLAQTAASANVNVEMLGESFKYAAPLAAAAGWSIEETAAAIGKMGDAGIQGSMAGTALRFAISELIGESDNFKDKLGELGMKMDDLKGPDGQLLGMAEVMGVFEDKGFGAAEMLTLFGKRAGPALAILLEQGEDGLADFTAALEASEGAAQRMADIQLDTFSGQLTVLQGSWELLLVTIGEDMMPILKNLLKDHIIPLVNGITEWIEVQGGLLGVIDMVKGKIIDFAASLRDKMGVAWDIAVAATGKLVEGLKRIWAFVTDHSGPITKAIIAIGAAFAAWQVAVWVASLNPLTIALTAVAAAGVAVAAFWPEITAAWEKAKSILANNETVVAAWNTVKDVADIVWGGIKAVWEGLVESFQKNLLKIQAVFSRLGEAASGLWEAIKAAFTPIVKAFQGLFGVDGETVNAAKAFEVLKDLASKWMDILAVQVTTAIELITGAFKIFTALLRGDWQTAWSEYKEYLKITWNAIVKILDIIGLKDVIIAGWEALKVKTVQIWGSIKDSISAIWDTVVSWFSNALQGLINTVTSWMPGWLKKWLGVGEDAGDNLADGLTSKEGVVESATNVLAGAITKPLSMAKETIKKIGADLGETLSLALAGTKSDVAGAAEDIGEGIGDGMAKGILDSTPLIESSISGVNQAAQDQFMLDWNMRSPSRLAYSYGADIMAGLANGIKAGIAQIKEWGNLLLDALPGEPEFYDQGKEGGDAYTDGLTDGIEAGTPNILRAEEQFQENWDASHAAHQAEVVASEEVHHEAILREEETFQQTWEASQGAHHTATERAADKHHDEMVKEEKSFWKQIVQHIDAGTADAAKIIGDYLNDLQKDIKSTLAGILKDIILGNKSFGDAVSSGMQSLVSSIWNSGIDAATGWVVDKFWAMAFGTQSAMSSLSSGAASTLSAVAGSMSGLGTLLGALTGIATPIFIGTSGAVAGWVHDVNTWLNGLFGQTGPGWDEVEGVSSNSNTPGWTPLPPDAEVPDWIPSNGSDEGVWTHGATGGLAASKMLAIIGEGRHDEALLPLNDAVYARLGAGIAKASGGSLRPVEVNVEMNIDHLTADDPRQLDSLCETLGRRIGFRLRGLGLEAV